MKLGKGLKAVCLVAALGLGLSACSTGTDNNKGEASTDGNVELTMSAWNIQTTPEFQALIDGFEAQNSNIKITLKEYDANEYENLMLTDMTAGKTPDIITVKQAKYSYQWSPNLLDVTDVVKALPGNVGGADSYKVDDKNYAVPYRQDSWVLYYNKDLFDKAKVAYPDGTWTWKDYADAAKKLTEGSGVKGTYEHSWESTIQGFANAQGGSNIFSANYEYMKPYYETVLGLQDNGYQETYGNVTTNKLTYQATFGKQQAAMMLMGSWYTSTLVSQQASGEADNFNWGIAPAPQKDSSTTGTDKTPITFGDPTGIGLSANIADNKKAAGEKFLTYIASEDAAQRLAKIGMVSSLSNDTVADAYFAQKGMPTDDLSKFAMFTHKTDAQNPAGEFTMQIQTILNQMHSSIMSESSSIDDAIAEANKKVANKDW
jgi:multiple sugar transport system substrate-binding protein